MAKKSPAKHDRSAGVPIRTRVESLIEALHKASSRADREGMARYAIPTERAMGVKVNRIRDLGKRVRREHPAADRHALALALWDHPEQWYESRMLAVFVDDPALVTRSQMDEWCREFDNWAICDTACFHLFDKSPHAMAMAKKWSRDRREFVKRGAFALIASVALHDKKAPDEWFLDALPLIERGADDERNFVKKGVSWALRGIGKRKSPALKREAVALARRLAASEVAPERWIGKDALRDLLR